MDRPRRLTPRKTDAGEVIGLLPEEEAALRKALLASMQSEKTINKKPSPLPPSKRPGSKRGGRRGKGSSRRARGIQGQSERCDNLDRRSCDSRFTAEDVQFSSSSPFTESEGMEMNQDVPEQSSDSDSNFSAEEFVRWTPSKKELSYNQIHLQESASVESDLSSYNDPEILDFQLTLSQSDSTTPNEVSSPLPSDSNKHCYQNLDNKFTAVRLYHAQKTHGMPHTLNDLGKQTQTNVIKTEDFLSFLCMRNENEQLPGLLQHYTVTKARGVARASSQCRKRKLADQKKKHSVAKKLLFYKQTDM